MKSLFKGSLALAAPLLLAGSASAQWADLELTVVYGGKAPAPKYLDVNSKDKCNADPKGLIVDKLLVNPENNGIANIVFTIETRQTKLKENQIHPDLRAAPSEAVVLDNVKCQFVPHVLTARVGQPIEVRNSDTVPHNAKFSFFNNTEVNPLIPAGGAVNVVTTEPERAPTRVDCNVHPWMNSYVIVYDHPYTAVSDADGKIVIKNLPAGIPIAFKIWHEEQDKSIEEVTLDGKKQSWKRGATELTLKEGSNNLGTLSIAANRFKSE